VQADIETIRRARRFAADYYRKHKDEWAGTHPSHLANKAITEAGKEFKIGFGCEGFCWNGGREGISYLNMGDTYATTILFDSRTRWFTIGCWGDQVERLERQGIILD
jgi:hypothetical protein